MQHTVGHVECIPGSGGNRRVRDGLASQVPRVFGDRICRSGCVYRNPNRSLHLVAENLRLALDVALAPAEPIALWAMKLRPKKLHVAANAKELGLFTLRFTDDREL